MNKRKLVTPLLLIHFSLFTSVAQTSDSIIYRQLTDYGITFTTGNTVELLMSGQEKFDHLFADIRRARHTVHLEYFNFRNDSIASLLFDILREKRREGVIVRALFDGFGNDSNNQPLLKHHVKSLREDSIDIYEFDPIRFPWVNHIWPRDHRKIVVIDDSIAYTGGMNVADYYIKGTEQVGSWRDMHCRLTGPVVAQLQEIFVHIWEKTTGEQLPVAYPRPLIGDDMVFDKQDSQQVSGATIGIVNREPGTVYVERPGTAYSEGSGTVYSPPFEGEGPGVGSRHLLGKNSAMRFFYTHAIDAAQDTLRIINPYFTLTPSLNKALKRALKRGVVVDILLSEKSDIPLTPDCCFYNAHKLMKRGARVWLYQPGFHHSKIMMVDGRFCTVGSANLDARGMRFDYEENAVILDSIVTRQLNDMFCRDTLESVRLTPKTWDEFRTPWQKFRGWFAHLLRPFL
ncbi:MAG: cardiolipin synthase [Prevotella sp.]|nr:cardiolipin synthase [Prevotella sp.]